MRDRRRFEFDVSENVPFADTLYALASLAHIAEQEGYTLRGMGMGFIEYQRDHIPNEDDDT